MSIRKQGDTKGEHDPGSILNTLPCSRRTFNIDTAYARPSKLMRRTFAVGSRIGCPVLDHSEASYIIVEFRSAWTLLPTPQTAFFHAKNEFCIHRRHISEGLPRSEHGCSRHGRKVGRGVPTDVHPGGVHPSGSFVGRRGESPATVATKPWHARRSILGGDFNICAQRALFFKLHMFFSSWGRRSKCIEVVVDAVILNEAANFVS